MIEASQILNAILKVLDGADIKVMNPRKDGLHFDAIVIAQEFAGKSLIEQHQMVMDPLKDLFASSLHAFSLKTYTPEEWERVKK